MRIPGGASSFGFLAGARGPAQQWRVPVCSTDPTTDRTHYVLVRQPRPDSRLYLDSIGAVLPSGPTPRTRLGQGPQ